MLAAMCLPWSLPANYSRSWDGKEKCGGSFCAPAAGKVELLFGLYRSNSHIVYLSCRLRVEFRVTEVCLTHPNKERDEAALPAPSAGSH